MMPRTGEGGARRIAGCQCSLGGMFVQWCHGKEAGAPGPGEHRLDVEGDMMTMRSYHQTRMRVPAILAVLAMILVFAGCGGRVVSVAYDAGVQYGNLSDAVAASDVVTVATIDRMEQADGDQQDLYDMTLKSGRVSRGLWKVVISRVTVNLGCEGAGAKDDFIAKYGAETKIIVLLAKTDDGTYQLSNLTQGIRRYDDTAFKECRTP